MIVDIKKSVFEDEIGVVVGIASVIGVDAFTKRLVEMGIRAILVGKPPTNIKPTDLPDFRGPGMIATAYQTVDPVDGTMRVNPSFGLPQVVVIPVVIGRVEGFDMNRYRRMFITITESNQATRTQLEGRIERANNDSPFVEYVYYYDEPHTEAFMTYEAARIAADALRDVQEGDDASRRCYDAEYRNKCRREAEDAKERANNARRDREESERHGREESERRESGANGSSGPNGNRGSNGNTRPSTSSKIKEACALLGIEFSHVLSALRTSATKAYKGLISKWHPDKWSNGTHEEKIFASNFAKDVNNAKDAIYVYCDK